MFIDFPATPNERVKLNSLAFSSRNDALKNKYVRSIAKPVAGVNRVLKKTARFCEVKHFRNRDSGITGKPLLSVVSDPLQRHWQGFRL